MKHFISNSMKKMKGLFSSGLLLVVTAQNALADLPTMQAPSRGEGSGIMATIKNHAYDAVILGGLLLGAVGFMKVAGALISEFGEVQAGRKKWGDLGMLALVGAILLVVIIWLITEASKIL
ncbi:MAG: TIGR03745 family integrating conjugative element membrane protein [Pasteurella oralis]|uniref:TIGR03745 family integrating conjugative element membrane protein n=1 Tax=Pasteurella oralis TaxID=1071947 RepID=UPI00270DF6E3|nr:TIGR03745 family integrating conjugative element membrane protein [Pasteurella oralis]